MLKEIVNNKKVFKMIKFILTIAIIVITNNTAIAQIDINKGVTNFVKPLHGDLSLLPKWKSVLSMQQIIAGNKSPDYNSLLRVLETTKESFYITDSRNYQKWHKTPNQFFDYWATPKEFARKGGGDCEDFAITWYYAARKEGFKPSQLNIWIGYLPKLDNLQHAILAVEINNKEYILNSDSGVIQLASDYMHKEFKLMFRFNESGWSSK